MIIGVNADTGTENKKNVFKAKEFSFVVGIVIFGISFLSVLYPVSFLFTLYSNHQHHFDNMSAFQQHRLLQLGAVLAVFWFQSIHGFVISPLRSGTVTVRSPRHNTACFVKQPTAIEDVLQSKKKENEIRINDKDDEAYQRKMALSFFLADTSLFGFVLLAVVGVSGAVLNACGFGYVVMPDGTLLIDTLEHFQMQIWTDAIPPMVTHTAL